MSSIFVSELSQAIQDYDNEAVVSMLEPRALAGEATQAETLLCGVLLLLPPLADYEAAAGMFGRLLQGERGTEAAIWDAYRFSTLMPNGSFDFEVTLRSMKHSAVAAHMLSMMHYAKGEFSEALDQSRRSIALRPFPFGVVNWLKLDASASHEERSLGWAMACDLVISKSAESDQPVFTVEGALQRRWDNLIMGTRLTSVLWDEYSKGKV
jgi:hypothetical protein